MKNNKDTVRITFTTTSWDWNMISDALDNYIISHMDHIDTGELTAFAEHIDETIGIKNFGPDPRNWGKA